VNEIDHILKKKLDSIAIADQQYRLIANNLTSASSDSLAKVYHVSPDSIYDYLMAIQAKDDSADLLIVENIIKEHGYPGRSLVGTPTNEAAFYVIQHSPKIKEYLPLLQSAAQAGELSATLVAMMEDRLLVQERKEQVYGTQLWGNPVKDSATGITKPEYYFDPILDPENVNKRRIKAGFTTTIEQYAKEMGIPYRIKTPWWWNDQKQ